MEEWPTTPRNPVDERIGLFATVDSSRLALCALPAAFPGAWRCFVDSAGEAEPSSARSVLSPSLRTRIHDFVHVPGWPNLENVAIRQRLIARPARRNCSQKFTLRHCQFLRALWRPLDSRWKDYEMRKGFTRKPQPDEPAAPAKNYITPRGLERLRDEHRFLLTRERPAVTEVVAWAASNGDRSENADYQYGKRRLRQIDRRIRFLTKRIDAAEVVDPEAPRSGRAARRVFFGATVRYANAAGAEREVSVVGADEVDLNRHHISWRSPLARALMKSGPGDRVILRAPGRTEELHILDVRYERIPVAAFTEPPGAEAAPKADRRT